MCEISPFPSRKKKEKKKKGGCIQVLNEEAEFALAVDSLYSHRFSFCLGKVQSQTRPVVL